MSYVDTRLHVVVRPTLEYRLPEAAQAVRRAILGDGTVIEAVEALQACVEHHEAVARFDMSEYDELCALCATVCSHTHEYLHGMAAVWRKELHDTRAGVRRLTRSIAVQQKEANSACQRHRFRAPSVVDREYHLELAKLRRDLDVGLTTLAGRPTPVCERPKALADATNALKESFAQSYGVLPTKTLMRLKGQFECELEEVQQRIAKPFVKEISRMLEE